MKPRSTLSLNLVRARKLRGLTQRNIADLLNIKRATYAAYEESRSAPCPITLAAICELLGVLDLAAFVKDPLCDFAVKPGDGPKHNILARYLGSAPQVRRIINKLLNIR